MYVCMYVCVHVRVCACMCVCVCVYVCVCAHTDANLHIQYVCAYTYTPQSGTIRTLPVKPRGTILTIGITSEDNDTLVNPMSSASRPTASSWSGKL